MRQTQVSLLLWVMLADFQPIVYFQTPPFSLRNPVTVVYTDHLIVTGS